MSNPGEADATPITSVRQLAEYVAAGCKPREAFRIGTEHEKFGFRRADHRPPSYEGQGQGQGQGGGGGGGIGALLGRLGGPDAGDDWQDIEDRGALIGLKGVGGWRGASVSLEPAGQLELSGAPLATLHETAAELDRHFAEVRQAAGPLGLGFAPIGFHPTATRAEMPWMPKSRYAIMRRYMPEVGSLGLDMMLRTCTVQVNLDYASEADMARKLRVGLLLQAVATAIFANSPFVEGRPSGFLSTRAHIWTDTDNARSGIPPAMLEDGFGFERHVEWLLDVPMYFVSRGDRIVDLAGQSFRAHMAGKLDPELGPATLGDFADHMTTAFTDVRLKRYLEMRGADAGSPVMMLALSAFWVGLLYDDAALMAAEALVRRRPAAEYAALRGQVPRGGLDVPWGRGTLRDLAREAVAIAAEGLRARGHDEARYLAPVQEIAGGGPTQAERWLERYHGAWREDAGRIFEEAAI